MEAKIELLSVTENNSFLLRNFELEAFESPYHVHPEYELTLILKGTGKRFVGSQIGTFSEGELTLLAPNIPHFWKSEDIVKGQINAHSIVIQFTKDFLGDKMLELPEFLKIKTLLKASRKGLTFFGETTLTIKKRMMQMCKTDDNFKRLMYLLEILQTLAGEKAVKSLDSNLKNTEQFNETQERIHPVLHYIVENFQENVSLESAADKANLSPSAFCKYFKKATDKTFMEVVMEYRINYAIQLLINSDKKVNEICFESGFKDVSQFHKVFKREMKMSPFVYRKNMRVVFNDS